jgi:uncharacterized protein (DUF1501 family)
MQSQRDVLDGLFVAEILQHDLDDIVSAQEAERLQIEEILVATAVDKLRAGVDIPKYGAPHSDRELALQLLIADARRASDSAYAEKLQVDQDATLMASLQEAQRVAAAEKKFMLDAAFAKRLQEIMDSEGIEVDREQDVDR